MESNNQIKAILSPQSIKKIYNSYIKDISIHREKLKEKDLTEQSKERHLFEIMRLQNDLEIFIAKNNIVLNWVEEQNNSNAIKVGNILKPSYIKIPNNNNLTDEEFTKLIEFINKDWFSEGELYEYILLSMKNMRWTSHMLDIRKEHLKNVLEDQEILK